MITTLHAGRFLELAQNSGWEFVRRKNITGVVGIVAVTPQGKLLLVEQYRIPVAAAVIELPAGLVGDEQDAEDQLSAAARELEEETGWLPQHSYVLNNGPSSAGLTNEICTLVRAKNLIQTGPGGGVPGENIMVHEVPVAEVSQWLADRAKRCAFIDHKIHAALWWLSQEVQP